jgi:hypothetical protein
MARKKIPEYASAVPAQLRVAISPCTCGSTTGRRPGPNEKGNVHCANCDRVAFERKLEGK